MKKFAALLLALLLAMTAGIASASSLDPFYALEDYRVAYDELSGEVFVEHDHRSSLKLQMDSWRVYTMPAFYHYESEGRWVSLLQLYFCIDREASRISKVTLLVDGTRYSFTDTTEREPWDDYYGLIVPCGKAAMQMLEAITTTDNDVRVRYTANTGDIDYIMSDVQIEALDDLYRAYIGSDFYHAVLLEDIDTLYPLTVEDASSPVISTLAPIATESPAIEIDLGPTVSIDESSENLSNLHILWDIPVGSTIEQATAMIRQQFGVEMELNDNIDPVAWEEDEDYIPVYTLMTPYEHSLSLLNRPVEATLYFKENKYISATLQVLGDEYSFAEEASGTSADKRYQRLDDVIAYFDLLEETYGTPSSGTLSAYEDVDVSSKDWAAIATPPIAYEVSPLTSAGDLDIDVMRAALEAHGNFRMEAHYGNLVVSMTCGSMTSGKNFSIHITLDFNYPHEDASASQAATITSSGHAPDELAELEGYRTLSVGMRGEDVVRLKNRMYELGYFKNPSSSNQYTSTTAEYVNEFLRANGVSNPDGTMTPEQQLLFYSDRALAKPKPITYERLSYKDVARNVDLYIGQRWKITTYVIQQIDDPNSSTVELILSADRRGTQVIYAAVENFKNANWTGKVGQVTRLLEGDKLEIRCEILGEFSYETIGGEWLTVPLVSVEEMTLYN